MLSWCSASVCGYHAVTPHPETIQAVLVGFEAAAVLPNDPSVESGGRALKVPSVVFDIDNLSIVCCEVAAAAHIIPDRDPSLNIRKILVLQNGVRCYVAT